MDKGCANKHRQSISGLGKVVEEQKWGRATARERYGTPKYEDGAPPPPDKCYPQFQQDQRRGNHYDHKDDWVRGNGMQPNFMPGYKGKK